MPEESPVKLMRSAYERAKEQLKDVQERSLTEIVDQPIDGHKMTLREQQDWYANAKVTRGVFGAKQAELSARFQLAEDAPFARRVALRVRQGMRDEKAAEES